MIVTTLLGAAIKLLLGSVPFIMSYVAGSRGAKLDQANANLEIKDAQLKIASQRPGSIDAAIGRL